MSTAAAPRASRTPRPGGRKIGRPLAYAPPGYRARIVATLRRLADSSERGWQSAAARALGVSPTSVSMLATGDRTPSLTVLVRLAREAGVNLHWLLVGRGPIAAPKPVKRRTREADAAHTAGNVPR